MQKQLEEISVNVQSLKPGAILAQDVYSSDGLLLCRKGMPLDDKILSAFQRFQVNEVVIYFNEQEQFHGVTSSLSRITYENAKQVLAHFQYGEALTLRELVQVSKIIVDEIIASSNFNFDLSCYQQDKEANDHAIRVCTYAIVMANKYNEYLEKTKRFGIKKINLYDIASAALLKDIGTACKDPNILAEISKGLLPLGEKYLGTVDVLQTKNVYQEYLVPYYSYLMLHKNMEALNSTVRTYVLFSRETENGKGSLKAVDFTRQPDRLEDRSYNMVASEILHLCSIFDKEVTELVQQEETLENFQVHLSDMVMRKAFSVDLMNLFMASIPLYPVGTKVVLDGQVKSLGVVVENFSTLADYHRPKVVTYPGKEIVDLRNQITTIAKNVCTDSMRFNEEFLNTETIESTAPKL